MNFSEFFYIPQINSLSFPKNASCEKFVMISHTYQLVCEVDVSLHTYVHSHCSFLVFDLQRLANILTGHIWNSIGSCSLLVSLIE